MQNQVRDAIDIRVEKTKRTERPEKRPSWMQNEVGREQA
jgi:hypothetical protein